ncbi:MAG: glycosyltransferase family 9 protein [Verrucomicrobia bacterium]|nr:glycosyltransferase family 9 protein [Verrucomicrobiota bacterium]
MPSPRVLVVKLSSLGDLFHVLPAVHAIREGLGGAVDWVTQTEYAALVRCFTDVERVMAFPRQEFPAGLGSFLWALRSASYDMVLDFQGLLKSALVAWLARAPRRIGPASGREGAPRFYTERIGPLDRSRHAVEQGLDLARHLGVKIPEPVFPVSFPPVEITLPRPRVALVPCSRWPTKNWPADLFYDVARGLQEQAGASVLLFGAPEDRETCTAIARGLSGHILDLCGRTSLVELGGWMAGVDLVISVDSGPMHIAAALGRPVLALFGPTDPARTGPYGPMHRVLQVTDCECRPCYQRTCEREDLACLRRISPGLVIRNALEMLAAI